MAYMTSLVMRDNPAYLERIPITDFEIESLSYR